MSCLPAMPVSGIRTSDDALRRVCDLPLDSWLGIYFRIYLHLSVSPSSDRSRPARQTAVLASSFMLLSFLSRSVNAVVLCVVYSFLADPRSHLSAHELRSLSLCAVVVESVSVALLLLRWVNPKLLFPCLRCVSFFIFTFGRGVRGRKRHRL